MPINPLEAAPFDLREVLDELRGTYDRAGFALSSFEEGFAFDVTVVHAPGFEPEQRYEPAVAYDSALAAVVPEDTMFFLSYFDVYNQSWLPAKDQLDDFELEDGNAVDEFLEEFADDTGIDLENDLLELLDGGDRGRREPRCRRGRPEIEVIALAEVNDEQLAEETIEP